MNPPNPTVVVTDWTFPDLGLEEGILKPHGVGLMARQCRTEADLVELCADADAVITQFARVNANVVSAMRKARAIVRYGVGVDNVDLDRARELGIPVCNVPDYCIDEVADQTLAFILAPHIASCSMPAVTKLRESAAHLALAAVRGEALPTIVNGVKR